MRGASLPYYDAIFDTCEVSDALVGRLGFKRMIVLGRDLPVIRTDARGLGGEKRALAVGRDSARLAAAVKGGVASACLEEPIMDKELLAAMADNDCILCVPMSGIMSAFGLRRARLMYRTGRLISKAEKMGVPVGIVTMAPSNALMCSYMQMVELARLMGVEEGFARESISVTNRRLVEDD